VISKLFNQESKTIAGAALLIGASAILSRALGLIRDRLLVGRFGAGDELDAYFAAFQIPNLLFALLVVGTLSVAFIPVFTGYLAQKRQEEAWHVANAVLTVALAVMGVICLVLIVAAPALVRVIAPGFEGEKFALTVKLTRIMMLSPLLFSVSAALSSVLNSYRRFAAVSMAPLLYNAAIIFGIVALSKPFGMAGVAWGAILGAALHALVQIPVARSLGWRFRPTFDVKSEGVREIGRLFLPRVFGVDVSQFSQLLGAVIGTTLAAGSVSLFSLAINIAAVPLGTFAIPFAIAAFPTLSDAAARGDRATFRDVFATTFRQILFFLIPLSAMAFILRVHVVRVVIGSSGLSWNETRLAAASLGLFVLALAFQGLAPLLARSFYALKNTLVPVLISFVALAANLISVFAFKAFLATGPGASTAWIWLGLFGVDDVRVLSVAAAFSIASFVQVVLLLFVLRRKFGRIGGTGIFRAFGKFFLGSAAAAWAAAAVIRPGLQHLDTRPFASVLGEAALATVAGLGAYGLVLWLLKSEELTSIVDAIRGRFLKIAKPMAVSDTQDL